MANVLEIVIKAKDDATKSIKGFGAQFDKLKKTLKTVGIAFAAVSAAITATIGVAVKQFIDYGVQLDAMAKKSGVAVDALAKLLYAGEQEGVQVASLNIALKFLGDKMFEAAKGANAASAAFGALGVDVKDEDGKFRDLDKVFIDIVDGFQELGSSAEKTAVSMDLFGISGSELLPMLKLGREGIEALSREAENIGIVMSVDDVKAAKMFADTMTLLKKELLGTSLALAKELMPSFQSVATSMSENLPVIIEWSSKIGKAIAGYIDDVGIVIGHITEQRRIESLAKTESIKGYEARKKLLREEQELLKSTLETIRDRGKLAVFVSEEQTEASNRIIEITNELNELEEVIHEERKSRVEEIVEVVEEGEEKKKVAIATTLTFWEVVSEKMSQRTISFADISSTAFMGMASGFGSAISQMVVYGESFRGKMEDIFNNFLSFVIKTVIETMVARWIAALFAMRAASMAILGPLGLVLGVVGTLGGGKFFQHGGLIKAPTLMYTPSTGERGIAGEAGPEALVPFSSPRAIGGGGVNVGSINIAVNVSVESLSPEGRATILTELTEDLRSETQEALQFAVQATRSGGQFDYQQ